MQASIRRPIVRRFPPRSRPPVVFERNLIRERIVAGLKAARARGRKGGRPAKLSAKEIKTIRTLLKTADIPVAEIAARFGVARSTLYRTVLNPAA
jgi:DNA invertase Pin-like site-specific DNA recombinase